MFETHLLEVLHDGTESVVLEEVVDDVSLSLRPVVLRRWHDAPAEGQLALDHALQSLDEEGGVEGVGEVERNDDILNVPLDAGESSRVRGLEELNGQQL